MNSVALGAGIMVLLGLVSPIFAMGQAPDSTEYLEQLAKWRKEQEFELTQPEGFLSVAGLVWLKDGESTIGSDPTCTVRLSSAVPARVGTLKKLGGLLSFSAESEVTITAPGADSKILLNPAEGKKTVDMQSDSTRVSIRGVTFMVITRGTRVGVRVFDQNCKGFKEFKGQKWYAGDPKFVVEAKFVPYDPPKTVGITNVLGDVTPVPIIGYAEFTLDGKTCRLDAQGQGRGLFINFRDLTSGKTTYPAGRFLDAPKPVNGRVTLDFNRAINPPCAFTTFATCPLPPRSNYLDVSIPAGEKTHHPVGE